MRRLLSAVLSFGLLIPTWLRAADADPRPADETAPRAAETNLFTRPVVPAGRVRLTTFALPGAKDGRRFEGQIRAIEDGVIVLAQAEGAVVRVREDEVLGVEVRKNGSTAMGALGALLGIPAGLILGGLVCATADGCSVGALWGGALGGAILGAAAMGRGDWEAVPVVRPSARRLSLVLQPARKGGGVGLQVSF
jgi:hypothetical protein